MHTDIRRGMGQTYRVDGTDTQAYVVIERAGAYTDPAVRIAVGVTGWTLDRNLEDWDLIYHVSQPAVKGKKCVRHSQFIADARFGLWMAPIYSREVMNFSWLVTIFPHLETILNFM